MDGRRLAFRVPLLLAGAAVAFVVSRHWPTDQAVHLVLGDAAPRVTEVRVGYAEPNDGRDDWERAATFHYPVGRAPRIVNHEPRLVNGEYDVEVELTLEGPAQTVSTIRRVVMNGGPRSIDVSDLARESK